MDESLASSGAASQYALVSYIPDALGAFLNRLRAELVPGCRLLSHLTLLPPRMLSSLLPQLVEQLNERLAGSPSFQVELADVEMFPVTAVVYLAIRDGRDCVEALHRELNSALLSSNEPFQFQPHITLAQQMPPGQAAEALELARRRWREWRGERIFAVEHLTFVRNVDCEAWETISEHPLQPAAACSSAVRRSE